MSRDNKENAHLRLGDSQDGAGLKSARGASSSRLASLFGNKIKSDVKKKMSEQELWDAKPKLNRTIQTEESENIRNSDKPLTIKDF